MIDLSLGKSHQLALIAFWLIGRLNLGTVTPPPTWWIVPSFDPIDSAIQWPFEIRPARRWLDSIAALAILFSFLTSAAVERDVKVKIFFCSLSGNVCPSIPTGSFTVFFPSRANKKAISNKWQSSLLRGSKSINRSYYGGKTYRGWRKIPLGKTWIQWNHL